MNFSYAPDNYEFRQSMDTIGAWHGFGRERGFKHEEWSIRHESILKCCPWSSVWHHFPVSAPFRPKEMC